MAIEVKSRPYRKNFSGNPVYYELYSEVAAGDNDVLFEIRVMYKPIGGAYQEVITLPWAPTNGTAKIDIKDMLHSQLQYGVPPFFVNEKTIWECTTQSGYFYLQFREITTDNGDPSWDDSEKDYECFILKGGINYFKHRGNNFWVNFFEPNNPFLTWQTSGTRVMADGRTEPARLAAANERMYLAWLCITNSADIKLRVKIYYLDGTFSDFQYFPFTSVNEDSVYYLPVGCEQLDLKNVNAAKDIHYWTVQVYDVVANQACSEVFKYELDNRFDPMYVKDIHHYRNSLGGLDSYRILGDVLPKLEYNPTESSKTVTPDYYDSHVIQSQRTTTDNAERQPNSGNIGDLGKEEQDRLRDIFVRRETYQEIDKKWWPIIVTIKSNSLAKRGINGETRFNLAIEWELAYEGGDYYTPLNAPLGDGVFTSNVCRAFVSPLTTHRDPINGGWALEAGENDPQNASEKYRYRVIKKADGSVAIDWKEVFWGVLENFAIADDTGIYTIEAQPICTNTIYGKKTTVDFDTTTGGGGGGGGTGGGGGIVGGGNNSIIFNKTTFSSAFTLKVNGDVVGDGVIGALNTFAFDIPDAAGAQVILIINDFTPSIVKLRSNAINYVPLNSGSEWIFSLVDIINGFEIRLE